VPTRAAGALLAHVRPGARRSLQWLGPLARPRTQPRRLPAPRPRSISNRTSKCTEGSGTAHDKESEDYFNAASEKTVRAYTASLNLARFNRRNWLSDDATMDATPALPAQRTAGLGAAGASVAAALDTIRKARLLTPRMVAGLLPVDPLALKAGLLGSNPEGLFKL
jgi:hypothetical protein